MAQATLSSKYQLVIPKEIRQEFGFKKGEKLIIVAKDGVIHLIPKTELKNRRGFIKGISTRKVREEKDRCI